MEPLYRDVIVFLSALGSIQLLVGPASSAFFDAINVLFSILATSDGSLKKAYEFGLNKGFNCIAFPLLTSSS